MLKPWRGHKRGRDVGGALMQAAITETMRLRLATLDMEIRRPAIRALVTRNGAVPVVAQRLSLTSLLMATSGEYSRLTIAIRAE